MAGGFTIWLPQKAKINIFKKKISSLDQSTWPAFDEKFPIWKAQ